MPRKRNSLFQGLPIFLTSISRVEECCDLTGTSEPAGPRPLPSNCPLPILVPNPGPPGPPIPVPPPTSRKHNGTSTEARVQAVSSRQEDMASRPSLASMAIARELATKPTLAREMVASMASPGRSRGNPRLAREDSSRSNHSENSFQTASSDPQINLIPRQISESYQQLPAGESAALERKSSVRALQAAQYSALPGPGGPNGQPRAAARTHHKSGR